MEVIRTARANFDAQFPRVRKHSHNTKRDFAGKLTDAREGERSRIPREVHDNLNQQIAAVSISISNIKRHLPESAPEVSAELTQLQKKVSEIAEEVRNLSSEIYPGILQHSGLLRAARTNALPQRKRQVLHFIVEGRSMKEIGLILNISRRTVEAYKYEMMKSLGIKSSAQLIRYGLHLEEL